MTFSDLPHATRLAIRDLAESLGARIEGYWGDCLVVSMRPTADRKGWSSEAVTLNETLQALGFERIRPEWSDPCTIPDDPYMSDRGCLFTGRYRPTRDPLPLCSLNSK